MFGDDAASRRTASTRQPTKRKFIVGVVQFMVNLSAFMFFCTAALGGMLHLYDRFKNPEANGVDSVSNGDVGETGSSDSSTFEAKPKEIDWKLAREAATLAFITSWQALKLWSQLVISILVPTSQKTFVLTRDSFIALQPSLLVTWEYFKNTSPMFKLALGGTTAAVGLTVYLLQEAKKRKLVEKISNGYYLATDYVSYRYNRVAQTISKRSRLLGRILPHMLFFVIIGAMLVIIPDFVSVFAKGVGGWFVVIGWPVMLSTRALVYYDEKYNARIAKFATRRRKTSKRRPSLLPVPLDTEGGDENKSRQGSFFDMAQNVWQNIRAPFTSDAQSTIDGQEDEDDSEEEMRPYLTLKNKKYYKTMRGVRPLMYPKVLDTDDESALEQIFELDDVLFWFKYWLMLAFPLVLEELPVTGHILAFMPMWPSVRMCYSMWLQSPGTRGAALAFNIAVPFVGTYWKRIELLSPSSKSTNFIGGLVLNQLPVGERIKNYFAEIVEADGSLVFTTLPFFFMPSFLASIGFVMVGLIKPMYSGIVSVLSVEAAAIEAKKRLSEKDEVDLTRFPPRESKMVRRMFRDQQNTPNLTVASASLHCTHWLEYWVVYTLFMFCIGLASSVLFWIPFWGQFQLGLVLWLQLPYFRGARRLFKRLLTNYYRFRKRYLSSFIKPANLDSESDNLLTTTREPKRLSTRKQKRLKLGRLQADDNQEEVRNLDDISFELIKEADEDGVEGLTEYGLERARREEESSSPPSPARTNAAKLGVDNPEDTS